MSTAPVRSPRRPHRFISFILVKKASLSLVDIFVGFPSAISVIRYAMPSVPYTACWRSTLGPTRGTQLIMAPRRLGGSPLAHTKPRVLERLTPTALSNLHGATRPTARTQVAPTTPSNTRGWWHQKTGRGCRIKLIATPGLATLPRTLPPSFMA